MHMFAKNSHIIHYARDATLWTPHFMTLLTWLTVYVTTMYTKSKPSYLEMFNLIMSYAWKQNDGVVNSKGRVASKVTI